MNGFVDKAGSRALVRMSYVKCDAHPSARLLDHVDCAESSAPRIVSLAALFIAVIDRNATSPGGGKCFAKEQLKCASGMSWTYAKRKLNFARMIAAIKIPAARRRQLRKESKVTLVSTMDTAACDGMATPFPSTPTQEKLSALQKGWWL